MALLSLADQPTVIGQEPPRGRIRYRASENLLQHQVKLWRFCRLFHQSVADDLGQPPPFLRSPLLLFRLFRRYRSADCDLFFSQGVEPPVRNYAEWKQSKPPFSKGQTSPGSAARGLIGP
jgi:hypothetical protein